MNTKQPPIVRANTARAEIAGTIKFNLSVFESVWQLAWSGALADDQAFWDAVPASQNEGETPITAATLLVVSKSNAANINLTLATLANPALAANPKVQALMLAIDALKADTAYQAALEALPQVAQDEPPFAFAVNGDGTLTINNE